MKDDYLTVNKTREDFITALIEAKEEGIIEELDLEMIKKIEDSYQNKEDKENKSDFSFVEKLIAQRAKQAELSKSSSI